MRKENEIIYIRSKKDLNRLLSDPNTNWDNTQLHPKVRKIHNWLCDLPEFNGHMTHWDISNVEIIDGFLCNLPKFTHDPSEFITADTPGENTLVYNPMAVMPLIRPRRGLKLVERFMCNLPNIKRNENIPFKRIGPPEESYLSYVALPLDYGKYTIPVC